LQIIKISIPEHALFAIFVHTYTELWLADIGWII